MMSLSVAPQEGPRPDTPGPHLPLSPREAFPDIVAPSQPHLASSTDRGTGGFFSLGCRVDVQKSERQAALPNDDIDVWLIGNDRRTKAAGAREPQAFLRPLH